VAKRVEEFRALGVNIIVITMSTPQTLARFEKERVFPIALFADPTRNSYRAFGLEHTTMMRIIRPSVIWKYLKLIARGGKVRRVPEGEDALQLGGDFLVARDGRLLWSFRSADPTDRPSVDVLLAEAKRVFPHL
jgi:AhpC/TSA antioxidant enzyme